MQRVICVGNRASKTCSARGANFIRTYKAKRRRRGQHGTRRHRSSPTPRSLAARGSAATSRSTTPPPTTSACGRRRRSSRGRSGGTTSERAPSRRRRSPTRESSRVPNGAGPDRRQHTSLARGHAARSSSQARDAAGNAANSAALTARVDNTAPAPRRHGGRGRRAVAKSQRLRDQLGQSGRARSGADRRCALQALRRSVLARARSVWRPAARAFAPRRFRCPRKANGRCRCGVAMRRATNPRRSHRFRSRCATTPKRPGSRSRSHRQPIRRSSRSPSSDNVSGLASGVDRAQPPGLGHVADAADNGGRRPARRPRRRCRAAGGHVRRAGSRARPRGQRELTTSRQPLTLTLPIRVATTMRAGFAQHEARVADRPSRRQAPPRPASGDGAAAIGDRRARRDASRSAAGSRIAAATASPAHTIQVFSRSLDERRDASSPSVRTDGQGGSRYTATGTMSRTLRFVFGGSPLLLPSQREVRLRVPAASSLRVDRRRVLNGQAVRFSGKVRSVPMPPSGKLVELQVRLSDRWQTFRTRRTDARRPLVGPVPVPAHASACSGTASGFGCRPRPPIPSQPAPRGPLLSASGGGDALSAKLRASGGVF